MYKVQSHFALDSKVLHLSLQQKSNCWPSQQFATN